MSDLAKILSEYGEACRYSMEDQSGKALRDDMNSLSSWAEHGGRTLEEMRDSLCLCPHGCGKWEDHCNHQESNV